MCLMPNCMTCIPSFFFSKLEPELWWGVSASYSSHSSGYPTAKQIIKRGFWYSLWKGLLQQKRKTRANIQNEGFSLWYLCLGPGTCSIFLDAPHPPRRTPSHKLTLGIWIFQSALPEATGNKLKSNKIESIFAMLGMVSIWRWGKTILYMSEDTWDGG